MKYAYIALLLSASAFCELSDAATWTDRVPVGWKMILSVTGDLNQDGKDDAVLVLEEENPANRKPNEAMGTPTLNLNPRRLVVLFKTMSGYRQIVSTDRFLPSESDEESLCLSDPLSEGGVRIQHGLLRVALHYWLSCGSYGVTHRTFSFRYVKTRFRLVGMDSWGFMRNSGDGSQDSINYLTGKQKLTTGLNEFNASKPKISWKSIRSRKNFYLDEMSSSCYSGDKLEDWCQ